MLLTLPDYQQRPDQLLAFSLPSLHSTVVQCDPQSEPQSSKINALGFHSLSHSPLPSPTLRHSLDSLLLFTTNLNTTLYRLLAPGADLGSVLLP